jgi:hypothetical protein
MLLDSGRIREEGHLMHTVEDALFYRAIGLALGEVHWELPGGPAGSAESADPAEEIAPRADQAVAAQRPAQPLPLTDIDLHVSGLRGSLPDAFRSLGRLVRRIVDSGRSRPTPVEQDYLTGYARELLRTPSSPFFLDPLALKAALDCPYRDRHAAQGKSDARTANSQDVT